MKQSIRQTKRIAWHSMSILAAALLVSGITLAQDESEGAAAAMPEMGAPEQMKQVGHLPGTWDVTGKMVMGENQEWQDMNATCKYSLTLDGAALMMEFESEMMGMPYKGMGLQCYSRESQEWQSLWADNMSGAMSLYTGNMDGDKMVLTGKEKWQGQDYLARITTYNMEDDSFDWKYEMSTDDGKTWMTTMEAHYTKRK